MEKPTAEELDAYINGFYDAIEILKQQETATINNTQKIITQL